MALTVLLEILQLFSECTDHIKDTLTCQNSPKNPRELFSIRVNAFSLRFIGICSSEFLH